MNSTNFKKQKILFFDSGCGGLSIYQEVVSLNKNLDPYYVFDSQEFPYSNKSEDFVKARVYKICSYMQEKFNFDVIVIACNTASTIALPILRDSIKVPIIGVVPAIKPAAFISKTKHIALLATVGTVKRSYTHDLIKKFASDCKVELIGSTELVRLVESKLCHNKVDMQQLTQILQSIMQSQKTDRPIDTIVLGCTHFPFLKNEIQFLVGPNCTLVDSGLAIAKRVHYVLSCSSDKALQLNTITSNTHDDINLVEHNDIVTARAFYVNYLEQKDKYQQCFKKFNFCDLEQINC